MNSLKETKFSSLPIGTKFKFQDTCWFLKVDKIHATSKNQPHHLCLFNPNDLVSFNPSAEIIFFAGDAEKLCGYTISETMVDVENNRWGLLLTHTEKDSLVAWVQSDPEGNGPGFLDVKPEI